MASIRTLWPTLQRPFTTSRIAAFLPTAVLRVSLPLSFPTSLEDLWGAVLRAVPKSKTTHSKKAMRSNNKGPKNKQNIVSCSACGMPKLSHHLCPNCYSQLTKAWKTVAASADRILGK